VKSIRSPFGDQAGKLSYSVVSMATFPSARLLIRQPLWRDFQCGSRSKFVDRTRLHIQRDDLRDRRTIAPKPSWIDVFRSRPVKHDSPSVRTPSRRPGVAAQFGQATERTPVGSNYIERRRLYFPPPVPARTPGVPIRSKRDPLPVRRPTRPKATRICLYDGLGAPAPARQILQPEVGKAAFPGGQRVAPMLDKPLSI
jgi:hypothetical protein